MTKTTVYIKDFKDGMDIKGFYLCRYVNKKTTRLGDEYLDVMLQDKTGSVRAKVWSFVNNYEQLFKKGSAVAVKGSIILYNDEKEINIHHINKVNPDLYKKYGYDKKLILKKIDINVSELINYLNKKINVLNDRYSSTISLLINKNIQKIKKYPSNLYPYNMSGGLLLEITDVLKLNDLLKKKINFDILNQEIILSSIILKKIGLIDYFNDNLEFSLNKDYEGVPISMLSVNLINVYSKNKKYEIDKLIIESIILNNSKKWNKYSMYVNSLYDLNISIK